MNKYDWSRLNHLQIGRYAEYYAKMEFTLYGFDVYTTEVDDCGIDFVVRKDGITYYDIQVKSIRGMKYIFFRKDKFKIASNLLAVVSIFLDGEEPKMFLVPSDVWSKPNELFVSRDYVGKKSDPEYGINISKKNLPILEQYPFDKVITTL